MDITQQLRRYHEEYMARSQQNENAKPRISGIKRDANKGPKATSQKEMLEAQGYKVGYLPLDESVLQDMKHDGKRGIASGFDSARQGLVTGLTFGQ